MLFDQKYWQTGMKLGLAFGIFFSWTRNTIKWPRRGHKHFLIKILNEIHTFDDCANHTNNYHAYLNCVHVKDMTSQGLT